MNKYSDRKSLIFNLLANDLSRQVFIARKRYTENGAGIPCCIINKSGVSILCPRRPKFDGYNLGVHVLHAALFGDRSRDCFVRCHIGGVKCRH